MVASCSPDAGWAILGGLGGRSLSLAASWQLNGASLALSPWSSLWRWLSGEGVAVACELGVVGTPGAGSELWVEWGQRGDW